MLKTETDKKPVPVIAASCPSGEIQGVELEVRRGLGAIGSASALALAAVLAFATIVSGLTTALAFAIVLSLAGMLAFVLIHSCETNTGYRGLGRGGFG